MAASTGVGLFQCVKSQAGQRSRSLKPPSSSLPISASGVAQRLHPLFDRFLEKLPADLAVADQAASLVAVVVLLRQGVFQSGLDIFKDRIRVQHLRIHPAFGFHRPVAPELGGDALKRLVDQVPLGQGMVQCLRFALDRAGNGMKGVSNGFHGVVRFQWMS